MKEMTENKGDGRRQRRLWKMKEMTEDREDDQSSHLDDSVSANRQHQLPGFVEVKRDNLVLDIMECCQWGSAERDQSPL